MFNALDPKRLRLRMVREQLQARGITDRAILAAMATVPRHLFVQEALRAQAYADTPLPIGYGQTISQPFTVAFMTEMLQVRKNMRILEIGTGSGYQATILAALGCTVFSIERMAALYRQTKELLRQLDVRGIHLFHRDGTLGLPEAAPFDRIIVTAGGPEIPAPLVDQLDNEGILLIPVGEKPRLQRLVRVCKSQGRTVCQDLGPAVFVDLVGDYGWQQYREK